jgi:hypothetical protein
VLEKIIFIMEKEDIPAMEAVAKEHIKGKNMMMIEIAIQRLIDLLQSRKCIKK